jgi:flagellar biosynthesis anti-sigma factor FlgM
MKITPKGPGETDLSQSVQNGKKVGSGREEKNLSTERSGESSAVQISPEARRLQRVAELARKGDELRAEKVKTIKEQIENGAYNVGSEDVAKSIVRSEVVRILEKK